jgi:hypothetical protein
VILQVFQFIATIRLLFEDFCHDSSSINTWRVSFSRPDPFSPGSFHFYVLSTFVRLAGLVGTGKKLGWRIGINPARRNNLKPELLALRE